MSETELERMQAATEEKKREKLKQFNVYHLVSIVDYNGKQKDWDELKKILDDFVIEKGCKIE